ncbi:UNVERIFIED_CONTAM: putative protein S-acyltransferase 12 [Sesamum latifolium]|uniref:S-acyltransferase n=1 Tax=Sesamum latifolium TaxID=2727402 RepID=A0AAW2YH44_9LAMI
MSPAPYLGRHIVGSTKLGYREKDTACGSSGNGKSGSTYTETPIPTGYIPKIVPFDPAPNWDRDILPQNGSEPLQLVLLTWSYFMVVFRDPGSVPANWKASPEHNVADENFISCTSLASDNSAGPSSSEGIEKRPPLSYCNRCQNGKPPRCHHCSVCQRCVLKMDHHCIWVVNCVGARNYKFFLLFVLYTFLETMMDTLVLLPGFMNFFQQAKHHSSSPGKLAITFLAFVLNLAFALSLLCFVVMHISLLLSNTTSVEVHEKKNAVRWKYDLGWRKNIEQVFGTQKALWPFPLFSKEDLEQVPALHGIDFPTRSDINV